MRAVAAFDPEAALRIAAHWPLAEVLAAYHERVRRDALAAYRHGVRVWASFAAFGSKKKPPELPEILRSDDGREI